MLVLLSGVDDCGWTAGKRLLWQLSYRMDFMRGAVIAGNPGRHGKHHKGMERDDARHNPTT